MKILVVGAGGREHALVWKIAQSPKVDKIYCAPANAGIAELAEPVDIAVDDIDGLAGFAKNESIDLTVVGPELPLTMGIVDIFESIGLKVFGASKAAAEIEGSKAFSKDLMKKYSIPTAEYEVFSSKDDAIAYIHKTGAPIVVKADGLAAGKGVIIAETTDEAIEAIEDMMTQKSFGDAGDRIVIEEYLPGEEASCLVFTDGVHIIPLPSAQDHKPVYDDDKGPNTGGMGAYSPAPVLTPELEKEVADHIILPTIRAMANEGRTYKGILYAGIKITPDGPKTLEFNARFGDPECQPILMRMKSDIVDVLEATINGTLDQVDIQWDDRATVCVVMASGGYPGAYEKGNTISGLADVKRMDDVVVFHAGTKKAGADIVSAGGRVLGVTAVGHGVKEAMERAYEVVNTISWKNSFFRTDIAKKALKRL